MSTFEIISKIEKSRAALRPAGFDPLALNRDEVAEGGCGVIGMASSEKVAGKHLLQALDQMRNRGNGKGGGIAAVGLNPAEFGVSPQIMREDYLLCLAYLDPACQAEVEEKYIHPVFIIDHQRTQPHIADHTTLPGLDVRPPEVVQYFGRVRPEVRLQFAETNGLQHLSQRQLEDEVVYQNTYRLNREFYSSTGITRAFVLSHGKDLLVLKMVGYGDDVVRYYQLENTHAHVWIGHHRYPTKGRVWHPGGAHPFIGMNEALVHNGDFANYASISEYLAQRHIYPLFLTDTEVSVQVFDLLHRTYNYPLEYVIEALAPTTERDFTMLPPEKQHLYHMVQTTHMHSSPDGPWFFLIAQSEEEAGAPPYRLTCITDTSMLRPQVFAWQQNSPNGPAIGFAASEKQGIDAALQSLAAEDPRFWSRADRYWNARGGSHTDGGAFIFSVRPTSDGFSLTCTDKFGKPLDYQPSQPPCPASAAPAPANGQSLPANLDAHALFQHVAAHLPGWDYTQVLSFLHTLETEATQPERRARAFETLTLLMDRRYPTGSLRRSSLLSLYDATLGRVVEIIRSAPCQGYVVTGSSTPAPKTALPGQTALVDARGFEPEGPNSLALFLVALYRQGFRRFMVVHNQGHRFIANGFGPISDGVRLDVYGSPGDYLASGMDGLEIYVHGSAQDQLAQIMKRGKLVVYGDVGQTFMYGAKGGDAYILGNAAGRPLINAVGRPRVVINGTCLDYLAESFMAGDPHHDGGFVVLNGVKLTDDGTLVELETPYPGGNLFSLASGGAIFVRDPHHQVSHDQLNGGEFYPFTHEDWVLIRPYLEENARLFGILIANLLEVDGKPLPPEQVFRKIAPARVRALQAEEAWVAKHD